MKSKFPDLGADTYPSDTGNRTERIGETPFRRCRQCGSVNDTRATAFSKQGDGLVDAGTGVSGDQVSDSGCWFCGSLFWQKTKPMKLPDDQMLPNPDLKKGGEV